MCRPGSPRRAAIGLLAMIAVGCGPREQDARAYLEAQGYAVTSLAKEGKTFAWVATKGNELCKGSLAITKGLGSTSQTNTSSCERDTSACKPGVPAACLAIADELYAKEEKVFPTKAAELYRVACEDGKGDACARVAEFEKIDKKWDLVREFAKKGCDLRSGEACRRLAATELEGLGTPKDEPRALELMKSACELGSLAGCRGAAGILYDAGKPAEAIGYGERLCAAKSEDGCFVLGLALHATRKDLARAATLLQAVCADEKLEKDKRGIACNTAGVVLAEGSGGTKDPEAGLSLVEKACVQGTAEACLNLAKIHRQGLFGTPRDKAKGDAFAAQACSLGKKEGCSGS